MNSSMKIYPYIPLRDLVLFPGSWVSVSIYREHSKKVISQLVNESNGTEPPVVLLLTQKKSQQDNPSFKDLYQVGTKAQISQVTELPDGTLKVFFVGLGRIQATDVLEDSGSIPQCYGQELETISENSHEIEAMSRAIFSTCQDIPDLKPLAAQLQKAKLKGDDKIQNTESVLDQLVSAVTMDISLKQKILETPSLLKRSQLILEFLKKEAVISDTEKNITNAIRKQAKQEQLKYIRHLREQALKSLDEEINKNLSAKGKKDKKDGHIPDNVIARIQEEEKKLSSMGPMSHEASLIKNYLDFLRALPWNTKTPPQKDLSQAEEVLSKAHYGMEEFKEKILQYLAVSIRAGKALGKVLCLIGPPGVGKTSIAGAIAKATGRSFVRIALGGLRDEADIRGHRRTYIGAMCGRIIDGIRRAGYSNPLVLLDEIDKISHEFRGDPSAALLEVLDPEQNHSFLDHYLDVPYDLSQVMFVCTANSWNIHPALLDRMEVVQLYSYSPDEKFEIALRHLLPKIITQHHLKQGEFSISHEAMRQLITEYTRQEAGVRNLERELANLAGRAVKKIECQQGTNLRITRNNLAKHVGKPRIVPHGAITEDSVGLVTGLAYTESGGALLSMEALLLPGQGKIKATGKLGEVMQESVQAAYSFFQSQAKHYGIDPEIFKTHDIHVHVAEGAIPKDGPSAGVGLFLAILSAVTGKKVRKFTAMTGEISLTGKVWAIGGLKEKLLAAMRGKITRVFIPRDNLEHLQVLPKKLRSQLRIMDFLDQKSVSSDEDKESERCSPIAASMFSAAEDEPEEKKQEKAILEIIPISSVTELLEHALVDWYTPQ